MAVREWEVDWDLQEEVRGINVNFQGVPDFGGFPAIIDQENSPIVCPAADTAVDSYGAWVEAIASTGIAASFATVQVSDAHIGSDAVLWEFDLGIGAAGSEVPIISEFPYSVIEPGPFRNYAPMMISFPHEIAIGVRLAFRLKSTNNAGGFSQCFQIQVWGAP